MSKEWIKNRQVIETTPERTLLLNAVNAAYNAIDTENVIASSVQLEGNTLTVLGRSFDLNQYKSLSIIGFGKASCKAAYGLEQILGNKITRGLAVGLQTVQCQYIQTYAGSHPRPSTYNVELSKNIVSMAEKLTEEDLVLVIVSGGGSSLLCWPMEECRQGQRLYEAFLKTGGNIQELNTIRKHISLIKGGGLAKLLYPAEVVSLIFSDVPGDDYAAVASGPTYQDTTTTADAQAIIKKYHLSDFQLNETPKEAKYFSRVTNIPLVSNTTAVKAIQEYLKNAGLSSKIISTSFYGTPEETIHALQNKTSPGQIGLGAGEIKIIVTKSGGTGGRNLNLGMNFLEHLRQGELLAAMASDGLDNSNCAGVIVDQSSLEKMRSLKLNLADYVDRLDGYTFFEKLGQELIFTGPTEANVSDFMLLYRSNQK